MNMRWDLSDLYPAFDSEKFVKDYASLDGIIQKIKDWCRANLQDQENAAVRIENYIQLSTEFETVSSLLLEYAELSQSVDSKNQKAIEYSEKIQKKQIELTAERVNFRKWLKNIPDLDELIRNNGALQPYRFYLQ